MGQIARAATIGVCIWLCAAAHAQPPPCVRHDGSVLRDVHWRHGQQSHPLIGQVIDPIQTLLIGSQGHDVSDVFVAGRHVVRNGELPGFDLATAHARAQTQFDGLLAKYPERTWKHPPVETIFPPSYPVQRRG